MQNICHKYIALSKQIMHINPKMDHRSEEANRPTSRGYDFFESGPFEETTITLNSPDPIVKYMYCVLGFLNL